MSEELKPCPFEKVIKDIGHNVYFDRELMQVTCSCGARGPIMAYTSKSAMEGWNTRQESQAQSKALTVDVEAMAEEIKLEAFDAWTWDAEHKQYMGDFTMDDCIAVIQRHLQNAALPSETAKDQRIRELEEAKEFNDNVVSALNDLVALRSKTITDMQRQIDLYKQHIREIAHIVGGHVSPECSDDFHYLVTGEVRLHVEKLQRQIDDLEAEVMQIPDSTARELDLEKLIIEMQDIIDKQEKQIDDLVSKLRDYEDDCVDLYNLRYYSSWYRTKDIEISESERRLAAIRELLKQYPKA